MTLVWAPGYNGVTDPDAQTYIAAVEAADGQAIEGDVALAINDFVVGCKLDGIWNAIKASCILAGARTLSGALVPLVGTAPTNYNFVSGDYNRETGLKGDGATKYLNTNRNNNSDPQNSNHNAIYRVSGTGSGTQVLFGTDGGNSAGSNVLLIYLGGFYTRNRTGSATLFSGTNPLGLVGTARATSSSYTARFNGSTSIVAVPSQTPRNALVSAFSGNGVEFSDNRISFYSIGESLDLALLDNRVSTLMTDIGAAIP